MCTRSMWVTGQLHNKLCQDERVVSMERTNARHLEKGALPEEVDLLVIDASFIGVDKLLPAALNVIKSDGDVVVMIKPQFQVGKEKVGKGGVVRDSADRRAAIDAVVHQAQVLGFEKNCRVRRTDHWPQRQPRNLCLVYSANGSLNAGLFKNSSSVSVRRKAARSAFS